MDVQLWMSVLLCLTRVSAFDDKSSLELDPIWLDLQLPDLTSPLDKLIPEPSGSQGNLNHGHHYQIGHLRTPSYPESLQETLDGFHPTQSSHAPSTSHRINDLPADFSHNSAAQVDPATKHEIEEPRLSMEAKPRYFYLREDDFFSPYDRINLQSLGSPSNSNNGHTDQMGPPSLASHPEPIQEIPHEFHPTQPSHLSLTSHSVNEHPKMFWHNSADHDESITKKKKSLLKQKNVPEKTASQLQKSNQVNLDRYLVNQRSFSETFKLVDFQPDTPSGRIAVEALRGLRCVDGKNLFDVNEEADVSKMIQLVPYQSNRLSFFAAAFKIIHPKTKPVAKIKTPQKAKARSPEGKKRYIQQVSDRRDLITFAWEKFSSSHLESVTFYTDEMMQKLPERKQEILDEIIAEFAYDGRLRKRKEAKFSELLKLLPLYIFYVDMINILLPEGGSLNEKLIETQREVALGRFFEFMEKVLIDKASRVIHPSNNPLAQSVIIETSATLLVQGKLDGSLASRMAWKAIHYWLLLSRGDISADVRYWKDGPLQNLKSFFTDLFISWINNT